MTLAVMAILIGATSSGLRHRVSCPVLTVPPGGAPPRETPPRSGPGSSW